MESLHGFYNGFIAILGAIAGFLFGGINGTLIALVFFIVMDFITGVLAGIVEKDLSSNKAYKGVARKLVELILVSATHVIDVYVIGNGSAVFTMCCFLFISTEGISLLENAARLGVPIPKKVLSILSQLKFTSGGIATQADLDEAKESSTGKSEDNKETSTLDEVANKEV